ncbi:MAG: FdtA/QdtA family cupin domain-containing protein [Bacteroidales bacterium]|nr:FdtA/QdtA family cupin domain-containing protein [Bacteroidales bacterium]
MLKQQIPAKNASAKSTEEVLKGMYAEWMPKGVRLIEIPDVTDQRGSLCFMEGDNHIPFRIERVFFLYNIPEGAQRGDHSHSTCAEVVFAVHGAFTMKVDDGERSISIRIDRPNVGILIPAGIWCQLLNFEQDTVCAVVASERFDATGYTYSYDEYIKNTRLND